MPVAVQSKKKGRAAQGARRQNEKAIREFFVTEDEDRFLIGRVLASLGHSSFRVKGNDGCDIVASPRGLFNQRTFRIAVGDFVLLDRADPATKLASQIIGKLDDRVAKELRGAKKITDAVWRDPNKEDGEADDNFEFDEGTGDEEEVDIDGI